MPPSARMMVSASSSSSSVDTPARTWDPTSRSTKAEMRPASFMASISAFDFFMIILSTHLASNVPVLLSPTSIAPLPNPTAPAPSQLAAASRSHRSSHDGRAQGRAIRLQAAEASSRKKARARPGGRCASSTRIRLRTKAARSARDRLRALQPEDTDRAIRPR